ncbi:recombinase family protein [Gillisia sp. JM1]|uniref:recombinase family protein n=1 Tax=Gillisia sp. JM1 TaxID=1283286 RepID=UPI00041810E0|nr:recombinase family protein [Gillisia sp. JM1]
MKARYVRISSASQNKERQLVKNHPNEKLFIDVCSGSTPFNERTEGKNLLEEVRANQINYLSVHAVDRLGRNLIDILNTLKILDDNGVTVKVDSLGIESRLDNSKSNPAFGLITTVMGQIAEMERATMLERQSEGIAIAKANGKYNGRVRGSNEAREEFLGKYPNVIKELKSELPLRKIAKLCDVSLGTVQKVKKYSEVL